LSHGFSPSVHGFNRLHQQDSQVVHRARANIRVVKEEAVLADAPPIVVQIRFDQVASHLMDRIDNLCEVQLHAAWLAKRGTGRAPGRSFDTTATDLRANFVQVFVELRFTDHDAAPPSHGLGFRCRQRAPAAR
jgi:hypothetical protein